MGKKINAANAAVTFLTHPSPLISAALRTLTQCLTCRSSDTDTIDTYQPRHLEIGTLDPSEQQSHPSRPGDP
ncbi:hypothetical protein JCM24511_09376 [Saitozyma sp. JCM 24511]|nr:hypothetical protein JCM24511_09376 [Saitozyma sp. JCM 24511]